MFSIGREEGGLAGALAPLSHSIQVSQFLLEWPIYSCIFGLSQPRLCQELDKSESVPMLRYSVGGADTHQMEGMAAVGSRPSEEGR